MQKRLIQLLILILPLGLIAAYKSFNEENKDKEKIITDLVINGLKYAHYDNQPIDDAFSIKVYDTYIEALDYSKKFLIQKDIDQLTKYRTLIDDEINQQTTKFLDLSDEIITKRTKEVESFYADFLKQPFDFTTDEYIELDFEKSVFSNSKEELKEEWRKYLKYQVMIELNTQLEIQAKAKEKNDTSVVQKTYAELEATSRQKVETRMKDYFHRLTQLDHKDRFSMYLNSISMAFDPHTNYYPPKDKEDFDIAMSGQLEGIGATLQEKDGYIKVIQIVPGSPSYKQGELKEGDLILKVAQGNEEAVDITGMRLDNAVRYIRGKKGTTVKLTVKKVDGEIKLISIVRDVVVIEETYAKSVIVKTSGSNKRIGYLYLPSFYVNFNEQGGGRRCADDVLKEIRKLKTEGIDGLIIDLRNNGGGSLPDVVKMAGFFIPKGPIVQVKQKVGAPEILSDTDPSTEYNGPMAVLVNSNSASASEIFAAALQDYKRAVIIGGNQTFGKGTVQRFINLDDIITADMNTFKPFGALKLTFQKFYRISGESTQLKGVVPDIILPDNYMDIEYGEKELDFHMPWDKIPSTAFVATNQTSNLKKVESASKKRVSSNSNFNLIIEQANSIAKYRDETRTSLKLSKFQEDEKARKAENERYNRIYKDTTLVEVIPLNADWQFIVKDSTKVKSAKDWHKKLMSDLYIKESIDVIEDL
jgi:carboxyl-terminal processing protease